MEGKMDESDFAIVMPVKDGRAFLDETVLSVITQSGPFTIRYHVQDGGSTDGTKERLKEWSSLLQGGFPITCKGVTFSWSSEPDSGLYDATNKGFSRCCKTKYMSWINSDDRYEPGAFASVAEVFGKFPDVDWIGGRPRVMAESGSPGQHVGGWGELRACPRNAIRARIFDGRFSHFLQQEGMFWRRALWENVGGLKADMRLAGDFDLWTRFAEHSDFVMADAFFGTFRVRTGQLSTKIDQYHEEIDRDLTEEAIAFRQTMAKTLQEADSTDAIRAAGLECRVAENRVFDDGWHITTRTDGLLGERDRLRADHNVLRAERDRLAAERDSLRMERDSVAAERDALLGSTSWRLTAPIRALGNLFR
jgi:glycosyltransferase involved in cell wall biosynthesis